MSVNKVILLGRLGQDPELKYTPSGAAVCNFSLATSETWNDKNSGQKQERTEWHSLVLWGKLADLAQSYLKKGSQIYIEGRIQTRDWEDEQGQRHFKTEVVVTTMQFLDSKFSENTTSSGQSTGEENFHKTSETKDFEENPEKIKTSDDYIKDDIPF